VPTDDEEPKMNKQDVAEVLAKPYSQQLLGASLPARLAYTGLDGGPRVIPIPFHWDGSRLVMATVPASAKVRALRENPRVAITVDTNDYPPKALLIRGTATIEIVDGLPDAYLAASRKMVPPSEFPSWEAGVRALYSQMAVITIEPDWAKLLDFETTIPKAVEDLVKALGDPRG
jgi:hypothetical protein